MTLVPPQILPFDFGNGQINVDDMVTITCAVNKGDLPIDITWVMIDYFGNEKRLITNDGIVITRSNQRISTLAIEAVQGRHRGNFTCIAKNRAGTTQHSAILSINGTFIRKPRIFS